MKKILLLTLICSMFNAGFSQDNTSSYSLDLTAGIGKVSSGNIMFRKNFYLGARKKFFIAPAVRLGYATAQSVDYISAPFEITKVPDNVDTLAVGGTAILTPNIALNLGYRINDKLSFVFDIDLFGISMGKEQTGTHKPGKASSDALLTPTSNHVSNPTSPNILLGGDNDKGTLSSGFMLNYSLNENISLRLGAGFLFTEYTTENALGAASNDRWRAKNIQLAFGAGYHF